MEAETIEDHGIDTFLDRYDETVRAVYGYLHRACAGERSRAEDLTQETYAAAVAAWNAGRAAEVTLPWLLSVARNKMVDGYRKADREARSLRRLRTVDPTDAPADHTAVLACVQQLAPLQRAVIALRFVDDLPVAEVARLLNRRVAAIDSLQRRALANLRSMLEETDDEH